MTSKISFFNLCIENIKRHMWLLVLTSLTYFIAMPLGMMIALQNVVSYEKRIFEENVIGIFSAFFGLGFHSVLTVFFAIICAIAGFAWLFSKKKVDLYHSIPIKREIIFASCYVNGVVLYLLPYLVSVLVSLIIISQYATITGSMLSMALITIGVHILFFLFFYNLMLVAVMLTGNMINCLITGGVLFIYAIAVRSLLEGYLSFFISTYYGNWNVLESMHFTSPLLAFVYFGEKFLEIEDQLFVYMTGASFALYLLQCFVLMVIAGAIALFLYKKRPSEAAGSSIAFARILNLYRILLVIPLSLGSGIFFAMLGRSPSEPVQLAWFCFGLIFGLVLSHGFIEVLFQMDIHAIFSYKRQLLATGLVVFLIAFSIRGDWFGINRALPKKENVSSMAISISNLDEGSIYATRSTGYIRGIREYIFENMELNTEIAYQMAEKGREAAISGVEWQADEENVFYVVKFNLKNGKESYKKYWLPASEIKSNMEEIYSSKEYKEVMRKRFQEAEIKSMSVMDMSYHVEFLEDEWIPEFVEIYCREYEALGLQEALDSGIVATIDFQSTFEEEGRMSVSDIPIYGACKDTLRFLEEHNIATDLMSGKFDPEVVERIHISLDNREILIDDREGIEKIVPYLYPDYNRSFFQTSLLNEEKTTGVVVIQVDGGKYDIHVTILPGAPLEEIIKDR